ncbi:MAG TPA: HXXEE domain-containing protein [Aquamicrobium sp.]|nr:HXXEE domain-containing protein [Aquamicrobium sp.]
MIAGPTEAAFLLALAATAHNVEEMIWLPSFPHPPALRWDVSPRAFRFAAAAITLVFWAAALALASGVPTLEPVVAGFALAVIVNAFLPHLALTVILRRYHPGTASGLLLVVPAALLYLVTVDASQRIGDPAFLAWAAAGAAGLAAAVPLLLALGRRLG